MDLPRLVGQCIPHQSRVCAYGSAEIQGRESAEVQNLELHSKVGSLPSVASAGCSPAFVAVLTEQLTSVVWA